MSRRWCRGSCTTSSRTACATATRATRLDRILWLNIGLDAGYVMVGITLIVLGGKLARRTGFIGAGLAVIVQGLALALLDLVLAGQISR